MLRDTFDINVTIHEDKKKELENNQGFHLHHCNIFYIDYRFFSRVTYIALDVVKIFPAEHFCLYSPTFDSVLLDTVANLFDLDDARQARLQSEKEYKQCKSNKGNSI